MPPKSKKASDSVSAVEDSEASFSSMESGASAGTVTSEQLERILEANHKSMAALISSLSTSSVASAGTPRLAQIKIPKWTDDETPFEYFTKFEKALTHNGIDKSTWGQLLPVYLAGRAQAAFTQVDLDSLDDYEAVKATMLESLGDTPASADRRWWTLSRQAGDEAGAFYLRVRATGLRRLHGFNSREKVCERVILSRFLSLLASDCYTSVSAKQPKNGLEAAKLVQEFEETRSFSRRRQPWRQDSNHHYSSSRREQGAVGGASSSGGSGSGVVKEEGVVQNSSASVTQKEGGKSARVEKQNKKSVTCYGCGEIGHIRPNCPNKVRRVVPQEVNSSMSIVGYLAGVKVSGLKVDTGADRTVVRKDFVPEQAYTGRRVLLDSWRGAQISKHRVARISIKVGLVEEVKEVAVVDTLDCPALLGSDLSKPLRIELMTRIMNQLKEEEVGESSEVQMPVVESEVEPVRATRAQKVKEQLEEEQLEEEQNVVALEQKVCDPLPLSDILDFPDSYFEDDPVPTPVEELSTWPKYGNVMESRLPDLGKDGAGVACLVKEQQADSSLVKALSLARKAEKGYDFIDGILVQRTEDSLGDLVQRIVVPEGRRLKVLELGHSHLAAGHFGFKKTFSRISKHFLWPRMWGQVKEFVRSCAGCQRAARNSNSRAPLQPLPCVGEPFTKVAFDLVGPLPKSTSGFRYILTMIQRQCP